MPWRLSRRNGSPDDSVDEHGLIEGQGEMLDSFAAANNANDVDDAVVTRRPLSFSEATEDSNDVVVDEPVTTRLSSWFSGEDDNRWRFDACPSSGWAA